MKNRQLNNKFFEAQTSQSSSNPKNLSLILKNARKTGILTLTNSNLKSVPIELFNHPETLEADEKFWDINPIAKIDLSSNSIDILPDLFNELLSTSLLVFKIRDNLLQYLPLSLSQCKKLKVLDISTNKISNLFNSTTISTSNYNDQSDGAFTDLRELKEFLAYDNNIHTLPGSLFACTSLQILDLHNNTITTLPNYINLPSLINLNLKNNRLIELPEPDFSGLVLLESLDLSENMLTNIPDLTNLKRLNYLNITQNKLTSFPIKLPVDSLIRLYLGYNKITSIPIQVI